jgi:hypothetical protein
MASIDDGKRRLIAAHQETHALRMALFEALPPRPTYRDAVARLQRSWKRATQGRTDNRLFFELVALAPDAPDNPLRVYVEELRTVVARDFRLQSPDRESEPADWACNYLHCAVEPSSGQGEPSGDVAHGRPEPRWARVWTERAALELVVSPEGVQIVLAGDDGAPVDRFVLPGANGYGDADWQRLAERAHRMLDEHLERMRVSYETNNADLGHFKHRNPSGRQRAHDDVPELVEWLLGNRTPDRTTRERLRPRAKSLGIAFPPPPR